MAYPEPNPITVASTVLRGIELRMMAHTSTDPKLNNELPKILKIREEKKNTHNEHKN